MKAVTRQCGDCQLCCKLLPVRSPLLDKNSNTKCPHQKFKIGCLVYNSARMPPECSLWNCRWLVDDAGGTSRPDRSHIVIDLMPDFITGTDNETGVQINIEVVQCWIDPRYPDAHRDPAFRAYVYEQAEKYNRVALIRYNARDAFTLVAPPLNNGKWLEHREGESLERTHSASEIFDALGEHQIITTIGTSHPPEDKT